MKILMISSEALPWSKTGGLGDVVFALTRELAQLGHEIKLFIPCTTENRKSFKEPFLEIDTPWAASSKKCALFEYSADTGEKHYLVEETTILSRNGVYGENNSPYSNNCERFSLFCTTVLNSVIKMKWKPDIIHTHDWPTALIPLYLKSNPWKTYFKQAKTVFSIHNLGYQGEFSIRTAHVTALPGKRVPVSTEDPSKINLMAGAISTSDLISTVSPTYSKEIMTDQRSHGLAELLEKRTEDLSGIVNGIDEVKWNPETDEKIAKQFSITKMDGKKECKKQLLKEFKLTDEKKPLIAMITRLADQKGINEAFHPKSGAIRKICEDLDINFVVVGTGEQWCEAELHKMSSEIPNFQAVTNFNEALSHRVEAGADFFLMPSRYEPCGLNQMYSSKYATVPIVRHTGGLADTVIPYTGSEKESTGYTFYDLTPDAIYGTVKYAVDNFNENPNLHKQLMINGMQQDFSWKKSAINYQNLYKSVKIK